jgi:hypothetical protein
MFAMVFNAEAYVFKKDTTDTAITAEEAGRVFYNITLTKKKQKLRLY